MFLIGRHPDFRIIFTKTRGVLFFLQAYQAHTHTYLPTFDNIYTHINAGLSIFPPPMWQLYSPVFIAFAHIVFVDFTVRAIVYRQQFTADDSFYLVSSSRATSMFGL